MSKHATHKLLSWAAMLFGALMFVSCGHHDDEPEVIEPPEPESRSRTVLVYMVATNNLGSNDFDASDISEMIKGAAEDQIGDGRLLIYHATTKGTMLKEVTKQGLDTLKVYDNKDLSVSVDRMRQVIADMKEYSPADDYGLVLWSHSTGWIQDGISEDIPTGPWRSYGADGMSNAKKMNITSMAYALHDAGLSFIYFDCCYMASVEVLYELRDCAKYFVASPTEVPADGMPYHLNLKYLFDTTSDLEEALVNAASTTFNHYNDTFKRGDCPCTMTVIRANKIEQLATMTKNVYSQATRLTDPSYEYQPFKVSGLCPYFDLDQYVESICDDQTLMMRWREALAEAVPYSAATPWIWSSTAIRRCCGLSTYILTSKNSITQNNYNTLSWYGDVAYLLF